jgi:lipid II:glycine glycyltransferase (peptidoglycan interpeptide bridge formation enzyme)
MPLMATMNAPPDAHLLQTASWMQFQEALGKKSFVNSGAGWSYHAVLEKSEPVFGRSSSRLYVPYGPIAKDAKALGQALISLKELAIEQKASYIRVEPYPHFDRLTLKKLGLYKSLRDSQPDMTWVLDLSPSENELLMGMTSLNRRVWRRRSEFGLSFEEDSSPKGQKDFAKFIRVISERTRAIPRSPEYMATLLETFGKEKSDIVFCLHNGRRLAGALYADDVENKTRYYLYAGSVDEAKKHSCGSALLCYLIFDAKAKGMKHFDFFGVIPAEIKSHPYAGYSAFKRTFGGHDVNFSGTWELPINKTWHTAIRFSRSVTKTIKKNHP